MSSFSFTRLIKDFLLIEFFREPLTGRSSQSFNNNKIGYLKIAIETTFWHRWWKQCVVFYFLWKAKVICKSNLRKRYIAQRYNSARPSVVSLRYHGLEPLQIECLREIWISKGWYNFNNNKIVYLKIATETTFWDRWWKQDVVSCFLQKKKAVNKSNLDMSNDGSNTLRHVSALLVLIYLVYTTLI